jgi:hypothetical protein
MCVVCVLTSPRITQVDPGDEPLPEVVLSHELFNWITNYEVIIVDLTLVGAAAPCGDAPMRQGIQEG